MKYFNEQFKQLVQRYPNLRVEQTNEVPAENNKWTPERIKKFIAGLRFTVRKRNAYFGYLLDKVSIQITDPNSKNNPTMSVDGFGNLFINPEFASSLFTGAEPSMYDQDTIDANIQNDPEKEDIYYTLPDGEKTFLGIIAHELMHIFKDHIERWGDRRKMLKTSSGQVISLWNIATDLEINDELLYKWGYYMIKNGIVTTPDGEYTMNGNTYKVRGKSPERIYNELDRDLPASDDSDGGSGPPKPFEPGDIIYDKKTKKWGEIVSISNDGDVKVGELTKEEAFARAKEKES